jgi:histidinol-phosphate/aromatic aminotransferase/cobyric acid decarboxylase-like protein
MKGSNKLAKTSHGFDERKLEKKKNIDLNNHIKQTSSNPKHSCNPKVAIHPHNHYPKQSYNEKARRIAHIVNYCPNSSLKQHTIKKLLDSITSLISFLHGKPCNLTCRQKLLTKQVH